MWGGHYNQLSHEINPVREMPPGLWDVLRCDLAETTQLGLEVNENHFHCIAGLGQGGFSQNTRIIMKDCVSN